MPQNPLVVGLIGKLPDGVNNLIWGFVGVKPHPVARALVEKVWQWSGRYSKVAERREFNSRSYLPNPDEKVPAGLWVPAPYPPLCNWSYQWGEAFCRKYLLERRRWKRPESIRNTFHGYWCEKN